MEALMSGVPVVATQIAGVSELVEDGVNGFLVPPSDGDGLRDRIQTLLEDGELRQKLGEQGAIKVREQFDINQESKKLAQLMVGLSDPRTSEVQKVSMVETPALSARL